MNQKTKILFLAIISFGFFGLAESSEAVTYYVDQGNLQASDSNSGTELSPWLTLTHAVATVVAGDTIRVKAGEYHDPSSTVDGAFNPANSGTAGNPIIIQSYPRFAAYLMSTQDGHSGPAMAITKDYIVVDGFTVIGHVRLQANHSTIKNCDVSVGWHPVDISLNWGIKISGTYNTVSNNYVHDMADSGNNTHNTACIMAYYPTQYSVIEYNTADAGNGVVWSAYGSKGGTIEHNIWRYNIAKNATAGFLGMAATADTTFFDDNEIYQNIIINSTYGIQLDHLCHRNKIYSNTAYGNTYFMWINKSNNTDTEIWNNITWGNTVAIYWSGYPDALPFSTVFDFSDYNDFYNYPIIGYREKSPAVSYTTLNAWQTATSFDANSIITDPGFTNTSGNYNLVTDFKRTSYPTDGRGGSYASVMGAYITGNETIGYTAPESSDTTPPVAPSGLSVN